MSNLRDITVTAIGADAADARDWEAYVQSHRAGTVYHRLAWRRIFGEGLGYPSWMLLARDRSSGAAAGALPLFLVRGLGGRRLVSVPFRDRGGVLWDTAEAFLALVGEAQRIAGAQGAGALQLKSIKPYPVELARQAGLAETRYWVNSRVDLARHGDDLLAALDAKVRNMLRQAERQGLRAEVVEPDASRCGEWYELHLRTQQKLGLPPFPSHFFRLMLEELGAADALRLCMVSSGSQTAAACILFLHGRTAIYGYSASDPARQHSRPSDLMLYTAMQWLAGRGYAVFDLGSDAPSQEGLLFFKRKWLAEQASIPSYASGRTVLHQSDSSSPRYRLARAALRIMPLPLLRGVASRFVRYFG